jgi:hypothetical protein
VNRNVLDFSLMFHDVKSPTRPTLISQEVGVSLTLTQRDCSVHLALQYFKSIIAADGNTRRWFFASAEVPC